MPVTGLNRPHTLFRGFGKEKVLIPASRIKPTYSKVPTLIGISRLSSQRGSTKVNLAITTS